MIKTRFYECKKYLLFALLLFNVTLSADKFVYNDSVLVNKTEVKIEQMANELFLKTGVRAYLYARKDINGTSIKKYEKELAKDKKSPFAILTILVKEQKVDIYNSSDLDNEFDKKAILSPFPWSGSIIPLLVGKKKNVNISAAMLNGYADMVEQIASSKNIKLESGIGNTNRDIILFVRMSIYLFLFIVIGWYFIRRVRKGKK